MNPSQTSRKLNIMGFLAVLLSLHLALISYFSFTLKQPEPSVLGQSIIGQDDVQIHGIIYGCVIDITTYPEKRVAMPTHPNLHTILTVELYDQSNHLIDTWTITTDNYGHGLVNVCDRGHKLPGGRYNIFLRGYSHLRKAFLNRSLFYRYSTVVDVRHNELLAGETSNFYNNKINSLDLSTQIRALFTNNYKNDLNQDTKVNSLDISNTIYNFYKEGD